MNILTFLCAWIRMLRVLCHVFPCFMLFLSFSLMLELHVHIIVWCCWLCFAQIYVFVCFLPCFMLRPTFVHVYMLGFCAILCLCAKFLHACMHVFMPLCLDLCFRMLVHMDLCSLHALCYLPCACVLHAMFVCLDLGYVCHAMCYCSPFVHFYRISCVLA